MQTPSITPVANPVPASVQSPNAASKNASATPFNQVLSQEVAQRKNAEARGPEGKQDKQAGSENRTQTEASKPTGEAQQADGKPAAEEGSDKADAAATAATDAAGQASADLLALVANVAQLKKTDGEAALPATTDAPIEGAEDALASGRKAASPFAAIQSALGARASRAAQDKSEGASIQTEAATTSRADIGNAAGDVLPIQAAATAQTAAANKAASTATEFSGALKDASQLLQPLQQAAAQTAQAASAPAAGDRLAPRVGTPAWDQALGQRIVWMVNGEQQNASLTLNPPELGPLKVVLQVTNAQASATFVAAQPEVRQALEAAMPRLRDMLGEAGIQLGQASVDSGSPQQQHASERQAARSSGLSGTGEAREPAATVTGTRVLSSGGRGLVDTFV